MGKRWFHMDAQTYKAAHASCEARHEATERGVLSVVPNVAETEYVVKVAGAGKAWRKSQPWVGDCLRVYDEGDHDDLLSAMSGIEWQGADPAAAGV